MRNNSITDFASGLTTLGALALIVLSNCEWPPSTHRKLHAAIGKAIAWEALRSLGNGGRIMVIARDTATFKQPAAEIQLNSFKEEIRKSNATIAAAQFLQVDPLRPMQVPPGDFFEMIRKAPAGNVIVSFMGPPLLTEEQRGQLGTIKPRIVAFCPGTTAGSIDLRTLFDQQLLHAAVVSRGNSLRSLPRDRALADSFDQLYVSVTAANLASLPDTTDTSQ